MVLPIKNERNQKQNTIKPNGCSLRHFFLSSFNLDLAIPDILMRKMIIKRLWAYNLFVSMYNQARNILYKASLKLQFLSFNDWDI